MSYLMFIILLCLSGGLLRILLSAFIDWLEDRPSKPRKPPKYPERQLPEAYRDKP